MSVHPGSVWVDRNYLNVSRGIWIATTANGIQAEHPDINVLITRLASQGVSLADVTITNLPREIFQ